MDILNAIKPESIASSLEKLQRYLSELGSANIRLTVYTQSGIITGWMHGYHSLREGAVLYLAGEGNGRDDITLVQVASITSLTIHDATHLLIALSPETLSRPAGETPLSALKAHRSVSDLSDRIRAVMGVCPPITITTDFDSIIWANGLDILSMLADEIATIGADTITTAFFASLTSISLSHSPAKELMIETCNSVLEIRVDLSVMPRPSLKQRIASAMNSVIV